MMIERHIGTARDPGERASRTTGVGRLFVGTEATTARRGPDAQKTGPTRVD